MTRSCRALNELYCLAMFSATASEAEAARSKKEIEDLLCKPVLSSENRLKCMKNIGEMENKNQESYVSNFNPAIHSSGPSSAKWQRQLTNTPLRNASLPPIRKSTPPGNTWSPYLKSAHPKQDVDILLTKWMSAATD